MEFLSIFSNGIIRNITIKNDRLFSLGTQRWSPISRLRSTKCPGLAWATFTELMCPSFSAEIQQRIANIFIFSVCPFPSIDLALFQLALCQGWKTFIYLLIASWHFMLSLKLNNSLSCEVIKIFIIWRIQTLKPLRMYLERVLT